ncbi:MAG: ACT domain-containing protein [Ruminiclostridium sp.]|nr:ACT domain-containing protein [Ruminiclostridium sp.]
MMKAMTFSLLQESYAVCRLDSTSKIPDWLKGDAFYSITKTAEELSVVCSEEHVPCDVQSETGWIILKIQAKLDFSLTGILAEISTILADQGISIFALSTYDTDYVMVKEKDLVQAAAALR